MKSVLLLGAGLTAVAIAASCTPSVVVCTSDGDCASNETCLLGEAGEGLCTPVDKSDGGPGDDAGNDRPDSGVLVPDAGPGPGPSEDGGSDPDPGVDGGPSPHDDAGPANDAGPQNDGGPQDEGDAGPIVPEAPRILAFTASEAAVAPGTQVSLTWQTEHATSCALDDGTTSVEDLPAHATDHVVTVSAPTTFTLSCTNGAGDVDEATLDVAITVGIPSFRDAGGHQHLGHRHLHMGARERHR